MANDDARDDDEIKIDFNDEPAVTKQFSNDGTDGVKETALVKCDTTAGQFTISLIKSWAPIGYERAVGKIMGEEICLDYSYVYI